jgi:broad specificity phosphatase PhoE
MDIVICRHGETDDNVKKKLQGRIESSINEHGKIQAKLIAEKLKDEKFDHVFCSPQLRCRQTISEIMKHHKNKVDYRKELMEIDIGKYSGMDKHEIESKFPGDWVERVDNKYEFMHEGGESYKQADEFRVKPFLKELKEKYSSRKILIVTHGGICRLLLGNILGLNGNEMMEIEFPNECIYYVEYKPHKTIIKYYLVESKKSGEGFIKKDLN